MGPNGGQQYRLTRDVLFVVSDRSDSCTIREGEICEYDPDFNGYQFPNQTTLNGNTIGPVYPAHIVESWGFWFVPID